MSTATHAAPATSFRRSASRAFNLLFGLALAGYYVWGLVVERGLIGWLLDLQMRFIGTASLKTAALVASFVLVAGYFIVTLALAALLKVDEATPRGLGAAAPAAAAPETADAAGGSLARTLALMALGVIALTWGIGYAVYLYAVAAQRDLVATMPPTLAAADVREAAQLDAPARLLARPLLQQALVFTSNKASKPAQYYIPLAPEAAGALPRLNLILHVSSRTEPGAQWLRGPHVMQRSRTGLPEYVRGQFVRDGLRLADEVIVVEIVTVGPDGRLLDRAGEYFDNLLIAGIIGTICGIGILAAAVGVWRQQRKARRAA